jgi:hypothetical protein
MLDKSPVRDFVIKSTFIERREEKDLETKPRRAFLTGIE